jgi:long-chain acyl-CoA synthetase
MEHPSIPVAHRAVAERHAGKPALRWKEHGRWREISWRDYRAAADAAAAGLVALGIAPGDRVAILAENRPEWLVADIAILSAGAIDVPLHATLAAEQVGFQLAHSGARAAIVSTPAQAAKIAAVADTLPDLEWVVVIDPGAGPLAGRHVVSWAGLCQRGRLSAADWRAAVIARERAITRSDLATIIYTSGTTGISKGVMLTHGNLLSNAEAALSIAGRKPDDTTLAWLPLSHIYARTCDHTMTMLHAETVAFAESQERLVANIGETWPHWMNGVPRFYEKLWSALAALEPAARAQRLRLVAGPRLREFGAGGAALPVAIAEGFAAAGIPILQGYGLTETSPIISFNTPDSNRNGTVGRPLPGVEVKIAADGEILTRGPHVMRGYWKDDASTRLVLDADGWFATGDVGALDADGYLRITDRKKDLIVTAGGKNVAPTALEALLVADPWIEQAVVFGEGRPFVGALLVPALDQLRAKAEQLGCGFDVEGERIVTPALVELIAERVNLAMRVVGQPERVRAFVVLSRPLDFARQEMTTTLKIRRAFVLERFRDLVDGVYASTPADPTGV